jgi:steroid Delta-isomerase
VTWDFDHHVAVFNLAVGSKDWDELVELFAPDATLAFVGPPVGPFVGRAAIAASYAADGPDDTIELIGPVTRDRDEDVAAFRWRSTGRTGSMRAMTDGGRLHRLVVTFDQPEG